MQPEQDLPQKQFDIITQQIDAPMHELYDLTPAEIAIVESAV